MAEAPHSLTLGSDWAPAAPTPNAPTPNAPATSEVIYGQSWARRVAESPEGTLLADGYSCRCQAKLIDGRALPHPVQALLAHVRAHGAIAAAAEAPKRAA